MSTTLKKINDFLAGLPMTIVAGIFLLLDLVPHLMEEFGGTPVQLSFLPFDPEWITIVISGIQLITKWPLSPRNVTIVSVALGVGYGLGSNSAVLAQLPESINLIFGGSGIVPAALFAIILNIILPKDEKTEVEMAEEILAEKKEMESK